MLKPTNALIPTAELAVIAAEPHAMLRGKMIKERFEMLLLSHPEGLQQQLPICLNLLLQNPKDITATSLAFELLMRLLETNDLFPAQYHFQMQIQCLTKIWSHLQHHPMLADTVVLKLWYRLAQDNTAAGIEMLTASPLLSSHTQLYLLCEHLKASTQAAVALKLLASITTPIMKQNALNFERLRDALFTQLYTLYVASELNKQATMSAVSALMTHGFTPRDGQQKQWMELLIAEVKQSLPSMEYKELYQVFIHFLTPSTANLQQHITLIRDKLLNLNRHGLGVAFMLLKQLVAQCPRAAFRSLLDVNTKHSLTEALLEFYATLSQPLQRYFEEELLPIFQHALAGTVDEQLAAYRLIGRHIPWSASLLAALSTSKGWNTHAAILLAKTNGVMTNFFPNLDAKLIEKVRLKLNKLLEQHQGDISKAAATLIKTLPLTSVAQQISPTSLLRLSQDPDVLVRAATADMIATLNFSQEERKYLRQPLVNLLQDENWFVTVVAANSLEKLQLSVEERKILLEPLLKLLQDTRPDVCIAAAQAIGKMQLTPVEYSLFLERLRNLLQSNNTTIAGAAAEAMGRLLTLKERQILLQSLPSQLQNRYCEPRRAAAELIGRLPCTPKERQLLLQSLMNLLYDDEPSVRRAAVAAIGRLQLTYEERQPFLAILQCNLQDSNPLIFQTATEVIGKLQLTLNESQLVIQPLLSLLKNRSSALVRHTAAEVIAKLPLTIKDRRSFLDILVNLLQDSAWEVRCAAAEIIGNLPLLREEQAQFLQPLLQLVHSPDYLVCQAAAETLSRWPRTDEVTRELQKVARNNPSLTPLLLLLSIPEIEQMIKIEISKDNLEPLNHLLAYMPMSKFKPSILFQEYAYPMLTPGAIAVDTMSLPELLNGLHQAGTVAQAISYAHLLARLSFIQPAEQLIAAASKVNTLAQPVRESLVRLLELSKHMNVPRINIDAKQLCQLIEPDYLDVNTFKSALMRIEGLLKHYQVTTLTVPVFKSYMKRLTQNQYCVDSELIQQLDLTTTMRMLLQQLASADKSKSDSAHNLLNTLPLTALCAGIAGLTDPAIITLLHELITKRINAENLYVLEMQLGDQPVQLLLEYYINQAENLPVLQKSSVISILKNKLSMAPVHAQQLCTESGPIALPDELKIDVPVAQADNASIQFNR